MKLFDSDFEILTPHSEEILARRLAGIRHVALDMDGTIYMGSTLFGFTVPFLEKLRSAGIGYSFLTNNPSKSIGDYIDKLRGLGIECSPEEMYTSSLATIDYIRANHPDIHRLFILGTPSMVQEFRTAGFEITEASAEDEPDGLIVGFDMTLDYERLCCASWWASRGKPYFATNPDRVCPTDRQTVLVDCGAICKCIEWATGRCPDIVLGKPDKNMLSGITARYAVRPAAYPLDTA